MTQPFSASHCDTLASPTKFQPGDRHGNFEVLSVRYLDELRATLYELKHTRIGSKVLYIANSDPENLFCLSFQTLPETSNGIAHILEHCVLCGSQKFPVRDPFFSMTRRSLNTYMNALTGADFTCYPAATQNEKDFYNLLDVYLDAVFHPLLSTFSFAQEGHRLAFEEEENPNSPLQIKGIVYNEMKGSLSSPMSRLMEEVSSSLLPQTPYGKNSGGDPKAIPSLTLEELRAFHNKYYHPSKCLFFFYGNLPIEKHLDFIEDKILQNITTESIPESSPIPLQPRFSSPVFKKILYPSDQIDPQNPSTYYTISWLTTSITNQLECLALSILDIVLMDTDAAPLKKALLSSRLCRQASSSLDLEMQEIPYSLVMSGLPEENAPRVKEIIFNTLQDLAKHGIPEHLLESALHQVEFERSEILGDGTPFGLILYARAALMVHHHSDPIWGLSIHSLFDQLKTTIANDPFYFSKLIERHFLSNPHYVEIVMSPSIQLSQTEAEEERQKLDEIQNSLSEREKQEIVTFSKSLEKHQAEEEDTTTSCLPTISIADIQPSIRKINLSKTEFGSSHKEEQSAIKPCVDFFFHETFTNNISYVDISCPMPYVSPDKLWLVRLFAFLLPQIGAGNLSYDTFLEEMQKKTGGISSALSLNCHISNPKDFLPSWHLRGKALNTNTEALFELFYKVLTNPRFDDSKRIRDLIEKHYTNLFNSLSSSSLKYATLTANKFTHEASALQEIWYGASYFKQLEALVSHYDAREKDFLGELQSLASNFLGYMPHVDVVVSAQSESIHHMHANKLWGISELPSYMPQKPWNRQSIEVETYKPGLYTYLVPQQTSFTAMSCPSVSYSHHDAPLISLAAHIMDNLVLHKRIREQGGAYGAGASLQSTTALFQFFSYRDPNIASSIQAFQEAIETIAAGKFDEEDLDEAKREIIQNLDAPIAPGSRAEVAYTWLKEGKTDDLRLWNRHTLLKADPTSVRRAVQQHFIEDRPVMRMVTFTGKELFEKEKEKLQAHNISFQETSFP